MFGYFTPTLARGGAQSEGKSEEGGIVSGTTSVLDPAIIQELQC